MECVHTWKFQATIWWLDKRPDYEWSDVNRKYGDLFYCEKCLDQRTINVRTARERYDMPQQGSIRR